MIRGQTWQCKLDVAEVSGTFINFLSARSTKVLGVADSLESECAEAPRFGIFFINGRGITMRRSSGP